MHWIAVHENILGGKLRGFRKNLECSEAEALGILTILWLWARKNADRTGMLANTDKEDICDALKVSIGENRNSVRVTEALIEEGWIDEVDGVLYIHDWEEWQSQWYDYLERKQKDTERKRRERARKKQEAEGQQEGQGEPEPQPEPKPEPQSEEKEPEEQPAPPKKKKAEKPPKTHYAENVSMYPEEKEKLVEAYGEWFVIKLIDELDNYKGSTGKKYKDDYRAILSWVVDKCQKKYPTLIKPQRTEAPKSEGNPFGMFM